MGAPTLLEGFWVIKSEKSLSELEFWCLNSYKGSSVHSICQVSQRNNLVIKRTFQHSQTQDPLIQDKANKEVSQTRGVRCGAVVGEDLV